jgi:hypothetical protein
MDHVACKIGRKFLSRNMKGIELRRQKGRWEDNVKWVLKGIGSGGMDWIHLTHDSVGGGLL